MLDTQVDLVHGVPETAVYGVNMIGEWRGAVDNHRLHAAQRAIAEHLDSLPIADESDDHVGISDKLRVLPGKPARVLLDRADEIEASLVVLGPHRRRGILDLHRTARAVLSHATSPVWIQAEKPRDVRSVIVPVDLTTASEDALRTGIQVARLFSVPVTVMHCFVGPDYPYPNQRDDAKRTYIVREQKRLARTDLDAFVTRQPWDGVEHESAFFEDDAATRAVDMQTPRDVIVMATHGRGAISSSILGSVTYAVLRAARGPVVAVPPRTPPP